jgi:hypothetical protein
MMKKLAFTIMATMLALPAVAQQGPAAGTVRQLCAADAESLCPGMRPVDQHKCLMGNISKVSQDCGTALANAHSAMKVFQQACAADVRQYCGSQPVGPQRHQCITDNQAQFSQACQSALAARQGGATAPAQ